MVVKQKPKNFQNFWYFPGILQNSFLDAKHLSRIPTKFSKQEKWKLALAQFISLLGLQFIRNVSSVSTKTHFGTQTWDDY